MMKAASQWEGYSYVSCAMSRKESCSSCSCKMFLKLKMLELNCEAQMVFSLVAFEQTKQINFCEILSTLTLHSHPCDSFSAGRSGNRQKFYSWHSCSLTPALTSENQDHKEKDIKLDRLCICCFFLVHHTICPYLFEKDKLKSQETKWFCLAYWIHLDTSDLLIPT